MAGEEQKGEEQKGVWPLPKFYFTVDIPGVALDVRFQEVSGLDAGDQAIEYRAGNSETFEVIKMPGLAKTGNVTMKKGVFVNNSDFWRWFRQVKMNTLERKTITVKLLDEAGNPTVIWTLVNAWPTKITSTDLKSDGNEVAIDTIEIAYESLTTDIPK